MESSTSQNLKNSIFSIVERYTVPRELFNLKSKLREDLGADSVTMFEILGAIESKYDLDNITENEIQAVETVGDVIDLVSNKLISI